MTLHTDQIDLLLDMIAIAKSGMLAALVIMIQYNSTEEELRSRSMPVYDSEPPRKEEDQSGIKVTTKEVDLTLFISGKAMPEIRVPQENLPVCIFQFVVNLYQSVTKHKAYKLQWPLIKEAVSKQFREMQGSNGKVSFKDYHRYWFSNFGGINEFLNFYGSMFRYGP